MSKLNKLYNEDFMSSETFGKIKCPVPLMNGDKDDYGSVASLMKCAKAISNVRISIIPGCHHVVFYCNFPAMWEAKYPFIQYLNDWLID